MMLRIGKCLGRVKLLILQTPPKVKRSKVEITRTNKYCAQKHQMYAENVIG